MFLLNDQKLNYQQLKVQRFSGDSALYLPATPIAVITVNIFFLLLPLLLSSCLLLLCWCEVKVLVRHAKGNTGLRSVVKYEHKGRDKGSHICASKINQYVRNEE